MNLKKILNIFKGKWKIIWFLVSIVLILFVIFISIQPKKYEVNFSLLIVQTKTQQTKDFKYDTYYALEAKSKIGDYLVGFLKSPENVNVILNKAGFDTTTLKPYYLRTFFRPYKISSQSIGIIFSLKNPTKTKGIVNGLLTLVNNNLEETYTPSQNDVQYKIKSTNPLITLKKAKIVLGLIIVFMVSFILLSLIILTKEYFSE